MVGFKRKTKALVREEKVQTYLRFERSGSGRFMKARLMSSNVGKKDHGFKGGIGCLEDLMGNWRRSVKFERFLIGKNQALVIIGLYRNGGSLVSCSIEPWLSHRSISAKAQKKMKIPNAVDLTPLIKSGFVKSQNVQGERIVGLTDAGMDLAIVLEDFPDKAFDRPVSFITNTIEALAWLYFHRNKRKGLNKKDIDAFLDKKIFDYGHFMHRLEECGLVKSTKGKDYPDKNDYISLTGLGIGFCEDFLMPHLEYFRVALQAAGWHYLKN